MTEEEMKDFFEWADLPLAMIRNNEIEGGVLLESIYQAFETRMIIKLKEKYSVVERMTPEEYEDWKSRMVLKP